MRRERPSGMVAVVFTDLVGSTDLMSRLGEAAFDELRRAHFATLAQALERGGGKEVKNTGDGVMATFGSVVDAIDCAVAMQQATERQARQVEVSLAIRVGLSVGEVTFEADDVFGVPVVEAARLVAAAAPGQILATAIGRALAAGRAQAHFSELGPLELKGLPGPVAAFEVLWEPLPEPTVPMPGLLTEVGRIFVGRDAEVERLRHLWKEAVAGERRVGLLGGEPGIGKTRLAAELAGRLHAEGAVVLAGRCDEDLGVPYQPFVEALRHYVGHASELRLGRHAGELARLVPEVASAVPGLPEPLHSDPETERYRLFDAVASWLEDVSSEAPVLLVLDDLQWAAKPTLLLLRHVLRAPEPARLLVVATYRDSDIGRGHPLTELLADLWRGPGADRLPVTGLDAPGVAAFLEQAAGHGLDEEGGELARAVWAETAGNPFFVVEVLRHLAETGALERRDGRWVTTPALAELGVPEGVRDVVGRRLSRLSEAANRSLTLAAVVGLEFEPAVVSAAGGIAEEELLAAVEEAAAARLVVDVPGPIPRNRFSHALVRATLYDELTAGRRVALHRRVAEAIERLYAGSLDDYLPALTHHWARAAAPGAEAAKAVDYATRAGHRALTQLAHDEAVSYYRQALELLDRRDAPQRLNLLISLGEAQRRAGDPTHRETLLEAAGLAQQRGDAEALARAAVANNRGIQSDAGQVDWERARVLEAALEATGPVESAHRARLLASLAAELSFAPGHERRQHLLTEALRIARRLGDPATLGDVLARRWPVMAPTAPDERRLELAELAGVAEQLGDPTLTWWATYWGCWIDLVVGDIRRSAVALDESDRLSRVLGQPFYRWMVGYVRSCLTRIVGQLAEAEVVARETFELGRAAGIPDAFNLYASNLFFIRYDQGRLDESLDLLRRAVAREHHNPLTPVSLAVALCELDRGDEARAIFGEVATADFGALPGNFQWLSGLSMAAEVCAWLGDTDRAAILHARLAPHCGLVAILGPAAIGAVDHYVALLAATLESLDEAEARFAAAEGIHERSGAPTWLARTRLEWARMLLTRGRPGDAERARSLLGQALAGAREFGLGNVERRAVRLLQ